MSRRQVVLGVTFYLSFVGAYSRPIRCEEEPKPDRAATLVELRRYDCFLVDATTDASEIKRLAFGCHSKLPDSALRKLAAFPELESLSFISDQVTDVGLGHLKNLPHLKGLYVNSFAVTDKGLELLQGLPKLEVLTLMRTQVTEKGLAKVQSIGTLKKLRLIRLNVSPELIGQLKGFKHLDSISISQTTFTDEQKRELTEALPNLSIR